MNSSLTQRTSKQNRRKKEKIKIPKNEMVVVIIFNNNRSICNQSDEIAVAKKYSNKRPWNYINELSSIYYFYHCRQRTAAYIMRWTFFWKEIVLFSLCLIRFVTNVSASVCTVQSPPSSNWIGNGTQVQVILVTWICVVSRCSMWISGWTVVEIATALDMNRDRKSMSVEH